MCVLLGSGKVCGATLIHPGWVLTAASCVAGQPQVKVGLVGYEQEGEAKVVVHPGEEEARLSLLFYYSSSSLFLLPLRTSTLFFTSILQFVMERSTGVELCKNRAHDLMLLLRLKYISFCLLLCIEAICKRSKHVRMCCFFCIVLHGGSYYHKL